MTLIRGGPAGPDGSGGSYPNEVEADRAALWDALGGRQGVIKGFTHAGVAGEMALDFTPGSALVGERAADGTASLARGYHVWESVTTRVQFAPASPAARNDAVIAAFVDVEDGPLGTGVTEVGPQLIAVTGVSGTTTPRTDADINAFVGRGGWVRLMDVPIASTDTEINVANIDDVATRLNDWVSFTMTGATGWSFTSGRYYRHGALIVVDIAVSRTGGLVAADSSGNITPDVVVFSAGQLPVELRPDSVVYLRFVQNSVKAGGFAIAPDGQVSLADMYPSASFTAGAVLTLHGTYVVV